MRNRSRCLRGHALSQNLSRRRQRCGDRSRRGARHMDLGSEDHNTSTFDQYTRLGRLSSLEPRRCNGHVQRDIQGRVCQICGRQRRPRVRIAPPFPAMSISPDGSRMVGRGVGFGTSLIIIGGDTPTMRDILKDENPMNPRISPDGKVARVSVEAVGTVRDLMCVPSQMSTESAAKFPSREARGRCGRATCVRFSTYRRPVR